MARDPFSWAEDYGRTMQARSAQEDANAQNALMGIFRTEAARQQPWSDLPVDLAKQNNASQNALNNSIALAGAKQSMKPGIAPAKVASVLSQTSKAYGIDPDIMITLADLESGFKTNARNPSGASGVLQFMPATAQQYGLDDPFDLVKSADAGARLTRDNMSYLEKNGIPVTAGTVYLAHQQGMAGAVKLLQNPNVPAEQIVGRKAVVQNGGRPGMTAKQFANMWISKADRLYAQRAALRNRGQQPGQAFGQQIKVSLNDLDNEQIVDPNADEDNG